MTLNSCNPSTVHPIQVRRGGVLPQKSANESAEKSAADYMSGLFWRNFDGLFGYTIKWADVGLPRARYRPVGVRSGP